MDYTPRYIGTVPTYGNFFKQSITPNSATTIFNLDFIVASSASILVIDNGATKVPDIDFTIITSGTQIQFTVAPITGHSVFILFLGQTLLVPTAGTFIPGSINPNDVNGLYRKSLTQKLLLNSNITVSSQVVYFVDTTGGSKTATLPASPEFTDRIIFIDAFSSFSTNPLIISRNGKPINSLTENYSGNINNSTLILDFIDNTIGWKLTEISDPISQSGKMYYLSS